MPDNLPDLIEDATLAFHGEDYDAFRAAAERLAMPLIAAYEKLGAELTNKRECDDCGGRFPASDDDLEFLEDVTDAVCFGDGVSIDEAARLLSLARKGLEARELLVQCRSAARKLDMNLGWIRTELRNGPQDDARRSAMLAESESESEKFCSLMLKINAFLTPKEPTNG